MIFEHIPLVNKGESKDSSDNFLIEEDKIFLMDNHRLALWCWFQKINLGKKYNLIHIDAHPDMSHSAIEELAKNKNVAIEKFSLDQYRNLNDSRYNVPLIRWDNYLKIFTTNFRENVDMESSISFTHHLGSNESLKHDLSPIYLIKELEDIFTGKRFINENKWIFNLDLDYFVSSQPNKKILFSDDIIETVGEMIQIGLKNNLIEVVTIAFSPECCGNWDVADAVYKKLNKKLNLKFKIS